MKKIFSIILAGAALLTACDLDKAPDGQLPQAEAFADYTSIEQLRSGLYTGFRACYGEESMILFDLQADYMHAIYGYSNVFGEPHKWTHTAADQDMEAVWYYYYRAITRCNFVINGIENELEFTPTADEQAGINNILGEAYLIRAIVYHELAVRYCGDYNSATASNANTGLPVVTEYDPTIKPGRETLAKTYEQILSDIAKAEQLLTTAGARNATSLTVDCVTALKARVYLQMDNYTEAAKYANQLIDGGKYALANSETEFQNLWTNDTGNEVIYKFYTSTGELGSQFGYELYYDYFSGNNAYGYHWMMPDYIPTQDCIDMYDEEDWRTSAYFVRADILMTFFDDEYEPHSDFVIYTDYGDIIDGVMASKFPGNPNLRTSSAWNYYNAWKVFRLAEMYLIAAEAAAQSGGDAATPLNTLRAHRGLEALPNVTMAEVKEERYREMFMEGTRMVDLKRWGDDLHRGAPQEGYIIDDNWEEVYDEIMPYADGLSMRITTIPAGDYRFVWPIPDQEIFANQILRDQQNPGWAH